MHFLTECLVAKNHPLTARSAWLKFGVTSKVTFGGEHVYTVVVVESTGRLATNA